MYTHDKGFNQRYVKKKRSRRLRDFYFICTGKRDLANHTKTEESERNTLSQDSEDFRKYFKKSKMSKLQGIVPYTNLTQPPI